MDAAFVCGTGCGKLGLRQSGIFRSSCLNSARRPVVGPFARRRRRIVASSQEGEAKEDDIYAQEMKNLVGEQMRWNEIPFSSLKEELDAIDEYAKEEGIGKSDPWPSFLRGAAYEHWGRSNLAIAQYETAYASRGLRQIPEYWLRKAYNAFKIGDLKKAEEFHERAKMTNYESVGNQLHFSFWFENTFKDFKPKHNGPGFTAQRGICMYIVGRPKDARESLAPSLLLVESTYGDLDHVALWFLAASNLARATVKLTVPFSDDIALANKILTSDMLSLALEPIAALFTGASDQVELAQKSVSEENLDPGVAMLRAFYIALYYDAYKNDKSARDFWLARAHDAPRGESPRDVADFIYCAAQNMLGEPVAREAQ